MAKGSRSGSGGGMFGGVVGHTGVVANVHTNCGPEDDTFSVSYTHLRAHET